MAEKDDRRITIDEAKKLLNKKYGEGTVMDGDDIPEGVVSVPTGCFSVDYVLGCGGIPRGRIIEIFGKESSGKSTLCSFIIGQMQKAGAKCLYVDSENAFDAAFATNLGVSVKDLLLTQPGSLEEAMEQVQTFLNTNSVDLIVVDSVATMTPRSEIDAPEILGKESSMGLKARLFGKALGVLNPLVKDTKTTIIFINQTREQIGVMYGPKETTPGGKALKFYSSVRLSVRAGERYLGANDEQIGNEIIIKAVKNKVAPPWRECNISLYYKGGIDLASDIFEVGVKSEIITKSGNTYSYEGEKLGVGREQAVTSLRTNKELYEKVQNSIQSSLKR